MKALATLALASAFALGSAANAFAEAGSHGCKAPVEPAAKQEVHAHCGASAAKAEDAVYKATGSVTHVDKAASNVTIAHGPVADLKWPAMTMRFGVRDKSVLDKLAPGSKVTFHFVQRGSQYLVTAVN